MSVPLPIDCLTPLSGKDALANAAAMMATVENPSENPQHPGVIAARETLIFIRSQLEPLIPDYAIEHCFGFVTVVSRWVLRYGFAPDGHLEEDVCVAPDDGLFRSDGWLFGIATRGHLKRTQDPLAQGSDNEWPDDLYCFHLLPSLPDIYGNATASVGNLVPINGSLIYDPRPRIN